MFFASNSLKTSVEVLIDSYSPAPIPLRHDEDRSFNPVKCSPSPAPSQAPPPSHLPPWSSLAHTKLPILAAYPYLAAGYRNGDHCEIWILVMRPVAYWQFSVGLNQGGRWGRGHLTGAGDGGHLTYLRRGIMVGCQTIAIEQHFYWCLFKLLLAKNI